MKPHTQIHLCLFTDSKEPSGVGEHMLTLAGELLGKYNISFVCPPSPNCAPFLERAGKMGLKTLPLEVTGEKSARLRFCEWLQKEQVTVLHAHAGIGYEGSDGVYAARAAFVPAIVRTEHLPYLITKPEEQAEHRNVVRIVDRLIAVSEEACRSYREAGVPSHKLRAVKNGISHRDARRDASSIRRELGISPSSHLALTVGRFTEQKGHVYLLNAIPAILKLAPNTEFVWVGSGPLQTQLESQIKELKLEKRVHLIGQRDDVPDLLAASDLFVLPSLFEGLPLIVLEAMDACLPVVATRVCGTSEIVQDGVTGRLVEPRDSDALAMAIIETLAQPNLADQWGRQGLQLLKSEFSADRMARQTAAIYDETLQEIAIRHAVSPMRSYQKA